MSNAETNPEGVVDTSPVITLLASVDAPVVPAPTEAMTIHVVLPPGSTGSLPHRHSGPAFGYVVEGAMIFELEGEAPRVVSAGEAFSEPGGDVIHYQDGNNLADAQTTFVVTMFGVPGEPMLVVVEPDELEARKALRFPTGSKA